MVEKLWTDVDALVRAGRMSEAASVVDAAIQAATAGSHLASTLGLLTAALKKLKGVRKRTIAS